MRNMAVFADVFVKHAVPLGGGRLEDAAKDAVERGMADALIGVARRRRGNQHRGCSTSRSRRRPHTPLLIGSGFDSSSAMQLLRFADGAIVGTSIKEGGDVSRPVDPKRVRDLRAAMRAAC